MLAQSCSKSRLALPVLAPALWPKLEAKARRGLMLDEHQRIPAAERNPEHNLFHQTLWEIGASQSDAATLTAENIDWSTKTPSHCPLHIALERNRLAPGSPARFNEWRSQEPPLIIPADAAGFAFL